MKNINTDKHTYNSIDFSTLLYLLNLSSEIIIGLDENFFVLFVNDKASNFFSIEQKNSNILNFLEVIQHAELYHFKLKEALITVKNSKESLFFETQDNHLGKEMIINWSVSRPTFKQAKFPLTFVIHGREILFDRINDFYSRQLNIYMQQLASYMPGSLYWKNKEGTYLGCNDFMVRTAGLNTIDDIIGKNDFELWPEHAESLRMNDLAVMENNKAMQTEEIVQLPNGQVRYFTAVKLPLRDETGNIVGIIGNSLDITDLKEAESLRIEKAKMNQALKDAEENALRMKMLAGSVAHELRTPFASIELNISAVNKHLPTLLKAYKSCKEANFSIDPIPSSIIEELDTTIEAALSELTASNLFIDMLLTNINKEQFSQIKLSTCEMSSVVNHAIKRYPFRDQEINLIHLDLSPNFFFKGDIQLFAHVVYNILKNALYYITAAGKGEIYIWTSTDDSENKLHFKDTGHGIPESALPKIFDKFFSSTYHGTGIGLSYCKMVMESFGGTITCQSVEGSFTEFILSFPKI